MSVRKSLQVKWLKELNKDSDFFKFILGNTLYCKACETSFTATQKSQVDQHCKSNKHGANLKLKKKRNSIQAQLEDFSPSVKKQKVNEVGKELCEVFLAANIPWKKLNHPILKAFLEKKMAVKLPEQSTLRKHYLKVCYNDVIEAIRAELKDCPIWLGVDETSDAEGRYVANVIVGKLDAKEAHPARLVNCAMLNAANSGEIARLVNDTLRYLWPNFNVNNLRLLVTDAAPYMVKAGKDLNVFYPSSRHVTCLAHALHRVCELVREMFPEVNELISVGKKVFLKAPLRQQAWRELCGELAQPPEPIITRWGTWLTAALYYTENFDSFKKVVSEFDPEDAASIESAQKLIRSKSIKGTLSSVKTHFGFLPEALKQRVKTIRKTRTVY